MLLDYFFTEASAPVVVTQGGHYVAEHRKKAKAHQAAIDAYEQEKLNQAKQLRQQIEDARNPKSIPEDVVEEIDIRGLPLEELPPFYDPVPQLRARLFEIERELMTLAKQRQMMRDEQDMEIILRLMNDELKKYSIH